MVSIATFTELALSLPEAEQSPHFEKVSFRVKGKIFATLHEDTSRCCLKFTLVDQDIYSLIDPKMIYPIPNKWGKMGYTFVELKRVKKNLLEEMLRKSYCAAAPKKLGAMVSGE